MDLTELITLDFSPEAYLTVLVVALFTTMAVQAFIKPALSSYEHLGKQYELWLNVSALAWALTFSYLGLLAAGLAPGTATIAVMVQTLFRGFTAMFIAVFGYKGYKGIIHRVSGQGAGGE